MAELAEDAVSVSVTGTVLVVAPVAARVTVALYVPAANPDRLTEALTVAVLVPDEGLSVNQFALSLAVQVSVPLPVLATVRGWADGFAPPTVPLKDRLLGLKPMAGVEVEAVTVRVTGMYWVELVALGAVIVMSPL